MLNYLKNISSTELIILGVIFILIFGAKAFVSLGKTAGQSVKEIRKIKKSFGDAVEDSGSKKNEGGA